MSVDWSRVRRGRLTHSEPTVQFRLLMAFARASLATTPRHRDSRPMGGLARFVLVSMQMPMHMRSGMGALMPMRSPIAVA